MNNVAGFMAFNKYLQACKRDQNELHKEVKTFRVTYAVSTFLPKG